MAKKSSKKPRLHAGAWALAAATFVGGVAALTAGAVVFGRRRAEGDGAPQPLRTTAGEGPAPSYEQARATAASGDDGHSAPDLAADAAAGERAPAAFRPDMDAPMSAAEREALRPATGPSPTLVDVGTSQPA